MNMLALTIILPLIGFVLLAFSRTLVGNLRDHWRTRWSGGVGDSVCRDGFLRQRQTGVQPAAVDVDVNGNFNIGFNRCWIPPPSCLCGHRRRFPDPHMFASSGTCVREKRLPRFFAYTNLFIASMVVLVPSG